MPPATGPPCCAPCIANEVGLRGAGHGIGLNGFADRVLRLPGGDLMIVDHKKSRTGQRQDRMQAGWDLQTEPYLALLRNPALLPDAPPSPFAGTTCRIGVACHLLNDPDIPCHGVEIAAERLTQIDTDISVNALLDMLKGRLVGGGAGRIRLNSDEDAGFFGKTCKFTSHALRASPLAAADRRP